MISHLASYPKVTYLPLFMFACGAYGFHSVKKSKVPPFKGNVEERKENVSEDEGEISEEVPENPRLDFQAFKKWVKDSIRNFAVDIVACKDVKKQGLSFLERMFKNKQVHDSLIQLLKGAVKDERFVSDSKLFGIDWIAKAITNSKTKEALKELVSNTFQKDTRV